MNNYKLYTDGAYQPDVDIAGIGGHLEDPQGNTVFEFFDQIHDKSSFKFHEVIALTYGLKKCLEFGIKNLECFSDDVSIRNLFNKEILSDISVANNPFRKDIFSLKKDFDHIQFYHLPRTNNKKADRLAGKILRIYKEDILPHRTRQNFIGQEHKLLHIPNLFCREDYEEKGIDNININNLMLEKLSDTQYFYLLEIIKVGETKDNIDENNPLTLNIYFIHKQDNKVEQTLILSDNIIQKKLTSRGLELLTDGFNMFTQLSNDFDKQNIGVMFKTDIKPLQKVEMVLRKRLTLPLPNTPLTRSFIEASTHFDTILVENNLEYLVPKKNKKQKMRF